MADLTSDEFRWERKKASGRLSRESERLAKRMKKPAAEFAKKFRKFCNRHYPGAILEN